MRFLIKDERSRTSAFTLMSPPIFGRRERFVLHQQRDALSGARRAGCAFGRDFEEFDVIRANFADRFWCHMAVSLQGQLRRAQFLSRIFHFYCNADLSRPDALDISGATRIFEDALEMDIQFLSRNHDAFADLDLERLTQNGDYFLRFRGRFFVCTGNLAPSENSREARRSQPIISGRSRFLQDIFA